MYIKNSWTDRDFAAAGLWVDHRVAIGPRKDLTALAESVRHHQFERSAGARPPRTHDLDIPGGVNRLRSHAIQPHRTVTTPLTPGTPLSTDCPTSKDGIGEMANRPYRELVGAPAWRAHGTRPDIALARPFWAQPRSRPLRCGQTSSTLPQGHQTVASHAGRQVPADHRLHR